VIAHHQTEAQLRILWPSPEHQTGSIVLLNDPFTRMDEVVRVLQTYFGIEHSFATEKMLEIHNSGSTLVSVDPATNLSEICDRLNAEWRAAGLPLYCAPQPVGDA
jgi:ATP-dependent Clp protease adapter protein ClpS